MVDNRRWSTYIDIYYLNEKIKRIRVKTNIDLTLPDLPFRFSLYGLNN